MAELITFAEAGERGLWEDRSRLKEVTCANHPTAQYLTKNPWDRSLHFIAPCEEAPQPGWPTHGLECPCPFSDLRVVLGSGRYGDDAPG